MKTMTTKFLTATLTLVLIIILTSAFNSQQSNGNKFLTMRTFQAFGKGSKIMIVYEDGKTEEIELEKYAVDNFLPNTVKINQAINNISNKGYELFSVTGAEMVSLYTFVKK